MIFFSHHKEVSLKLPPPAVKVNFQQNYICMMELYFSGILQLILVGDVVPEIPAHFFFLENETETRPDSYILAHWKGENSPFSILHCNIDCLDL